ncbi:Rieske (2Fe-2S) protein [Nocardioides sp.]|uniref:Rieske (2Fe-2S) protein n=1 Tax=Nocardioides sp. TaxID=35761 RepID=UPI0035182F37
MTDAQTDREPRPTRRMVFQGLGALGVAVALAGCGGGDTTAAPAAGEVLVPAADVPVGGGVVLSDAGVVVTQPVAGTFEGYSNICTHQGLPLARVGADGIECDVHGSRFSITDGSVANGPADAPLGRVAVRLEGDNIVTA